MARKAATVATSPAAVLTACRASHQWSCEVSSLDDMPPDQMRMLTGRWWTSVTSTETLRPASATAQRRFAAEPAAASPPGPDGTHECGDECDRTAGEKEQEGVQPRVAVDHGHSVTPTCSLDAETGTSAPAEL